jgi:glycosyltransferase involved in cell wall biosynthesis
MRAAETDSVIQIVPQLEAGGAERTTIDIAAALARRGVRPIVLSEGGRLAEELEAASGTLIPFPAATKNPATILANARRIVGIARRKRAAILHARSRAPAWSAWLAARWLGIPLVTTYHGAYRQTNRVKAFYNSVMARGDAVIANSRYTERLILERHPFAAGRVTVIYRGTDLSRFDPAQVPPERGLALRQAWGISPESRIVLLPARLTPWKGQRDLVEAAARLASEGGNLVFVLAGDAQGRLDYVDELRARIETLRLANRIRIVGHVEDMAAAFVASDLVVTPSTEPEAFGRSAVEAQAMGIPVVLSDLGAARETVLAPPDTPERQRTGWRVPPGDHAALASAIAEALALSPSDRQAMAARARRHVAERFTLEAMSGATLGLYERVLGRPLRGRIP